MPARPAAAEPMLEQPIVIAAKAHFLRRMDSPVCAPYFRYYAMDLVNWTRQGDTAKAEVTFYVQYITNRALYGTAPRTEECLGAKLGEGYFEQDKTYPSATFVYKLSRWEMGWHVDEALPLALRNTYR